MVAAQEDGVVPLELVAGAGEVFVGEVVGEVLDVEAAGVQGGGEPLVTFAVGGGREVVEALLMDGVHDPGFARDENAPG